MNSQLMRERFQNTLVENSDSRGPGDTNLLLRRRDLAFKQITRCCCYYHTPSILDASLSREISRTSFSSFYLCMVFLNFCAALEQLQWPRESVFWFSSIGFPVNKTSQPSSSFSATDCSTSGSQSSFCSNRRSGRH